jgi:hypothetical protein
MSIPFDKMKKEHMIISVKKMIAHKITEEVSVSCGTLRNGDYEFEAELDVYFGFTIGRVLNILKDIRGRGDANHISEIDNIVHLLTRNNEKNDG